MMKEIKRVFLVLFLFVTMFLITGCGNGKLVKKSDYTYLLGTIVKVTLYAPEKDADQYFEEMFALVAEYEELFSKNIDTSEVSMINKEAGIKPVKVSEKTLELLELAIDYSALAEGKFDITIGPLVNLWDIGGENERVPAREEINEVLPLIDYRKLSIDRDNQEVMLLEEGMVLDLGGIAKGYVADRLVDYMREKNLKHGIINLGGNIVTVGGKPDKTTWKIGIQNPIEERGKELGIISCDDLSIVTSGIYERYIEHNGLTYHHIFDPDTGYPFDNRLASVAILSKYSVDGDGFSTMIFAFGLEKGYEIIENTEDVEAIFITKDNELYMTSGVSQVFELTNNDFVIKNIEEVE